MENILKASLICALLMMLFACGPKEIGKSELEPEPALQATAAEQMRYPVMGSDNTQRMLYFINQPEVMEQTQKARLFRFRERLGLNPNPSPEDPAYREKPRQRSPFRQ